MAVFTFVVLIYIAQGLIGVPYDEPVLDIYRRPLSPPPFSCDPDEALRIINMQMASVMAEMTLKEKRAMAMDKMALARDHCDLIILNSIHATHGLDSWQHQIASIITQDAPVFWKSNRYMQFFFLVKTTFRHHCVFGHSAPHTHLPVESFAVHP